MGDDAIKIRPTSDIHEKSSAARHEMLPLGIALVTLGLTYWTIDSVAPALPNLQTDLHFSGTEAGLVFALFFAGRLIANLPAAILVDRLGTQTTAGIGAMLLLAGSLLATAATSSLSLLPARGLQGIGVALLATAGLLSVLRANPGRGAAMTAFNLAAGLGGSGGLIAGGALTTLYGWRAVFALSAGLGGVLLAAAVVASRRLSTIPTGRDPRAVPDQMEPTAERRAIAAALLINLLVFGIYSIWVVSLPLFAAERLDAGSAQIGTLLLLINIVHLAAAIPTGRLIRRIGAVTTLSIGFATTALGLGLVLIAPDQGWLILPLVLYAIGQGSCSIAAGDLVLRLGGRGGRAVGMVRLTSDIGLVAGPAGVGFLADAAGVGAPFAVLGAIAACAALVCRRPALLTSAANPSHRDGSVGTMGY